MAKHKSELSDAEALKMVQDDLATSQKQLSTKLDDCRKNYQNTYWFDQPVDATRNLHQVFIPKIYETIWNMIPKVTGNSPKYVITPLDGEVDSDKLEDLREFADFEWKRSDGKRKTRELVQSAGVQGTAFMAVEWCEEALMVWDRKKKKNVEKGKIAKNKLIPLDIFDVWIDPRYSDIQESPYVLYVKRGVALSDLEAQGYKVDEFKGKDGQDSEGDDSEQKKVANFMDRSFQDMDKQPKETGDVYYYYSKNSKGQPIQIISLDMKKVLKNGLNPFPHQKYPIEKLVYQEVPGEAYGIGVGDMSKNIQTQINKMTNNRLDNVFKILQQRFIYDTSKGKIDESQFRDLSNVLVKAMGGKDAITPIQMQDVTGNAYNEVQLLDTANQTLTGINNFSQDGASGFNSTKGGMEITQNLANQRMNAVLENLEMFLAKVGEQMIQNTIAFQEESLIKKVSGSGNFDLDGFDFPFNVGIESGSTSTLINLKEKEEAGLFLQNLTPFAQAGILDLKPILDKFLNAYQVKNPEEFYAQKEEEQAQQGEEAKEEGPAGTDRGMEILMKVATGEQVPVNPEESQEIMDSFQVMASTEEFSNLDREAQNRIMQFVAQHQQSLEGGQQQPQQQAQQPQQELPPEELPVQ